MHGYVAREGFGITLIKNQIVDIMPIRKNKTLGGKCLSFIQSLTLLNFPFNL
jgi:hypothetical protein